MRSHVILRIILGLCSILVISVYFLYRPVSWPVGADAFGCLGSFISLVIALMLVWILRDRFTYEWHERSISSGLWIGLLWAVEIGINNFLQPKLPLRDYIDDIFWAAIAILILIISFREAYRSGKISYGVSTGFWSGFSSGAVACFTALLLIVFGLRFVMLDPLNLKEWADVSARAEPTGMAVYFAYQTLTGAIMHLYILGALMGLILGMTGGLAARLFKKILHAACTLIHESR